MRKYYEPLCVCVLITSVSREDAITVGHHDRYQGSDHLYNFIKLKKFWDMSWSTRSSAILIKDYIEWMNTISLVRS